MRALYFFIPIDIRKPFRNLERLFKPLWDLQTWHRAHHPSSEEFWTPRTISGRLHPSSLEQRGNTITPAWIRASIAVLGVSRKRRISLLESWRDIALYLLSSAGSLSSLTTGKSSAYSSSTRGPRSSALSPAFASKEAFTSETEKWFDGTTEIFFNKSSASQAAPRSLASGISSSSG